MLSCGWKSRIAVFALVALGALACGCSGDGDGQYTAGGRNIEASEYVHSEGFPQFPDRVAYLGQVRGDWRSIGYQLGERAGQSTRYVSDIWWKQMCESWGKDETLRAFALYEAEIVAFDSGMIELMQGIAEGASPWLSASPYADEEHALHATNYERVLAVNLWDAWSMMHPREFPDGKTTYGGSVNGPAELPHMVGCSAFAASGEATMNGETLTCHNRHSPYDPRCYEQVYILEPEDGCVCWVLSNLPQVAGNQVVNEHGVSLVLLAGGMTNPRSLHFRNGRYVAEAFGVPWFHLFVRVGTLARSADEAIEMLTQGTPAYRKERGRESLLRCGGWNFLVTDSNTLAVVEATSERYAVRYAGTSLPFTGPSWTDQDFIVATNHYICNFSYDAANQRTDVPMTIFNEGYWRDPQSNDVIKLTESGERFWTLMWDLKHHYGQVDRYRAQQIMSGTYAYQCETGVRTEVALGSDAEWHPYGQVNSCTAGHVSLRDGTCDSKIAVIDSSGVSVSWTMGNPIHWQGAWDRYVFD